MNLYKNLRGDRAYSAIWRDGKVVRIPADQIEVREPQVEYTVSRKKRK